MSKINLNAALKKYFGFDQFKGLQEEVVHSVYNGENTFVIMPTGGGKSLCYQLPALIKEGTAIVVSPLIALMKNQVDAIESLSSSKGTAHVLNSSLNKTEIKQVKSDILNGITKLLYVAPESLIKEEYASFLQNVPISFVAIDEAHCISEWGHDFRPEYRNLRSIIDNLGENIPIVALTATATPKVQEDILKNLNISDAKVYKASFNRPNLYYEVRPKTKYVDADITRFVKSKEGKSGIIYCLSRKRVEELAQILQVNGVKAVPYHAGLDAKTRVKHQDMFLTEDVDVVVATIAFGMGIDKPDVRFVIHNDIPKSIESYYQETGRAGRDGGEGHCLAFYSYKDIEKLEKFMSGKPVAEQEIGMALLQEIVAFAETSMSRRKFILHYFGEDFDNETGEGGDMDDNMRYPKQKNEAQEEVVRLLEIISKTNEQYKAREIVNVLIGESNALIKSHKTDTMPYFGAGKEHDRSFWMALLRQVLVAGYLKKDIELYGVIQLTKRGREFMKNPSVFMMTKDHSYSEEEQGDFNLIQKANEVIDKQLFDLLKKEVKRISKRKNLPPYVIFQETSLEDMALKYPVTMEELANINGVSEGKAKKFGTSIVHLIANYVEENDIIKPEDFVVKTTGSNSALKLYIIQNVDRKLPLTVIAEGKHLSMEELIKEMEAIVYSGTKLDISYWIDEILEDYQQEEIEDYFLESDSDKIDLALEEFEDEYEEEELRLYRIRFISEKAN